MSRADLVAKLAPFGVAEGYVNVAGSYVSSPTATLAQTAPHFLHETPGGLGAPMVCTPGRYHPDLFGTLIMENGHTYRAVGYVNAPGYHILYTDTGLRRLVIAAPESLRTPTKSWGWQVQLYAARSRDSWGIGDFRDLGLICRIAASQGASCVQVSPVHAIGPTTSPQDSPYSPASRTFLNVLHIAPGLVPGAERVDLSDLAAAGRALNDERLIDRTRVWALKREALERIWAVVSSELPGEYCTWKKAQGVPLLRFATWCTLVEQYDSCAWREWPDEVRRPDSPGVREYAAQHADRVAFHCWCQWVAQAQYDQACNFGVDVLADLAVGFDANSEDAWAYQDQLCFDFEIGAPPDSHNIEGQRWGLPPFNPRLLQQDDFRPFISMVHAALSHASALRIDHVMQLWRLFWVPVDGPTDDGIYVYYQVDALLAILRVEAGRRGAWIVGEDMGTVAAGVRETMAAIGMLGNRSAMRTQVDDFPELGVGTSSTHDQVTVAGLLTGSDVDELVRIGKDADFTQMNSTRRGLAELAHIDPDKPVDQITDADIHDAVLARYQLLSTAPSRVVVVSLDDAAMAKERPNMPGTVGVYPNWRWALPDPVEQVMT
ncbi:MAG: 4-alpha-glucanotransferase, partial [Propionibacteriaceae bacterium]|nr:4-alpha-glucanotransferase [Propionibacteriaceae bacterium]